MVAMVGTWKGQVCLRDVGLLFMNILVSFYYYILYDASHVKYSNGSYEKKNLHKNTCEILYYWMRSKLLFKSVANFFLK